MKRWMLMASMCVAVLLGSLNEEWAETWARTYGGPGYASGRAIVQTPDGGFLVAGASTAFGPGSSNWWVLRLDAAGAIVWQKSYGGSSNDRPFSAQLTSDGGYVIAGEGEFAGDVHMRILRLDALGTIQWQKLTSLSSYAYSITQTTEGGFVVTGYANKHLTGGGVDLWVLKLNALGDVEWQKTYGTGGEFEYGFSIQQTSDGGYVVGGVLSHSNNITDIWIVRLDGFGNIVWQKQYGGSGFDEPSNGVVEGGESILQLSDHGFLVAAGVTTSFSATPDAWVFRLDSSGNIVWQKSYGSNTAVTQATQAVDGNFILSTFFSGGLAGLKIDGNGNILWQKGYGAQNGVPGVSPSSDGGAVFTTLKYAADFQSSDVYVVRVDANGNVLNGCGFVNPSFVVKNTNATAIDTLATVADTTDTGVTPTPFVADTTASSSDQCTACSGVPNGTACDDGNPCTQTDTCQSGICTGSNPVTCTGPDSCHGFCDPATGLCTDATKPDGATCTDGNACTQTDSCQAGICVGSNPRVCTSVDQCHTAGTCDPATGVCSNPSKPDGTTCNDNNQCTQTDTCQSGNCSGSNPVVCTPLDQCHAAACNPTTGACSNSNKPNGSLCNDGNACTQTDTCLFGICRGSNPFVCTALDQCHVAGTCDASTGVCSNPNKADGSSCSDGNACTQTDTCQAGACAGSNPVVCIALDQCHNLGTCAPATGTCSNPAKPDGSACNDGSACTTSDTCISGGCVGGPPPPEVCNGVDDNCDGTIDEGCVGKVTGGGEIDVPGGTSNFGFVAQRKAIGDPVTGQLEYMNHARGLNVHSTSILTLFVNGNTATFTGECTKNQAPCTFSVTVVDNAEPGRNVDHFSIAVSAEPGEGAPDPIIRGNIQTHATGSGFASAFETAADQSPSALAGAGGGTFPAGTSFNGVPLTGLRFGVGINIPGNGSADGTHETTLLGLSPLGQPQIITLEVAATSGYVTPSGSVYVSGSSSVDMGDGTPLLTGVPFTLATMTDAQGQGVMTLAIDTTSLPVATIDHGRMTPPLCIPPTEVGSTLAFTNTTALSWSSSEAAASYNLYRGTIGGGLRPFDHACLAPALPGPAATDFINPSSGQTFYYLVSGKNACGEGPLGAMSSGQPRPNITPCP